MAPSWPAELAWCSIWSLPVLGSVPRAPGEDMVCFASPPLDDPLFCCCCCCMSRASSLLNLGYPCGPSVAASGGFPGEGTAEPDGLAEASRGPGAEPWRSGVGRSGGSVVPHLALRAIAACPNKPPSRTAYLGAAPTGQPAAPTLGMDRIIMPDCAAIAISCMALKGRLLFHHCCNGAMELTKSAAGGPGSTCKAEFNKDIKKAHLGSLMLLLSVSAGPIRGHCTCGWPSRYLKPRALLQRRQPRLR